jgi:hypothetical protein
MIICHTAARAVGCAVLLWSIAPAQASPPAILGNWATDPRQCVPAAGMIGIDPMQMTGSDFRCDFNSVAEKDQIVVWQGTCYFRSNPAKAEVEAHLVGSLLHLRINGADNGGYRRCTR